MDIAATTTSGAKAASKASGQTAVTAAAGDFQTFLTLLTTQMRNQDPLKPMESTEFVAQLASFSAVEQQVRSNDRLDSIIEALTGGSASALAEWIGTDVRAPASTDFDGTAVEVGVMPEAGIDAAVLVVRNDFGTVVARRAVDPEATTVTWDGLDEMGSALAHGRYSFSVESYSGEELVGTQAGAVFSSVQEVRLVGGAPTLVLADGSEVTLDQVTAVR